MTSKELVLKIHRDKGRADALALREKAAAGTITDTEIIDREEAVPAWGHKNYIGCAIDTPVSHEGQVYGLVQPYDASIHTDTAPGTANGAPFWRVKHTTNPAKAKPWVQPDAVNLYKIGECMIWTDGLVYQSQRDTTYSPEEYAPDWLRVEV